ncbi:MAG: nucleotidyl transferase AbiEii/AbiGii toxin family protein [Tannerella sp.]|nr:nucleotidyl transferase AbiEii/AbiGii toxin family protein [Tannerella sp.]
MEWLKLPKKERVNVLTQASKQTKLPPQAIEKDWWVTMVLKSLFSMPFAGHLLFKGGTSLGKCWELIERFSEDVDIAIDREYLGFGGDLSRTQISDKLRRASCSFTRETLQSELKNQLIGLGIPDSSFSIHVEITSVTTTDPEMIEVHYISDFSNVDYIQNKVLIEVSGRSMNEPKEKVHINSIVSRTYPDAVFSGKSFEIEAVSPKRTFLEKACLLHEEFAKATKDIRIERMSRHLYDLEKMADTSITQEALNDTDLYKSVIEHRRKFIGLKDFDYGTLMPQTISFVPPKEVIAYWEEDYKRMQSTMIYGESLPFDKLIKRIGELNTRFRNVKL